jgi:hypothetical protein
LKWLTLVGNVLGRHINLNVVRGHGRMLTATIQE